MPYPGLWETTALGVQRTSERRLSRRAIKDSGPAARRAQQPGRDSGYQGEKEGHGDKGGGVSERAGVPFWTCGNEIEQHVAGQGQNDHAEQNAGKKLLLVV